MNVKKSLEVAQSSIPGSVIQLSDALLGPISDAESSYEYDPEKPYPTEKEFETLPKISGSIPWTSWTVAVVEFAERFSYYGTTAVYLPEGSKTGAGFLRSPGSGALGMGQRASTGLVLFNSFWSYVTPLLGAYVADEFFGRYLTIQYSIAFALVGHVILIMSAIPPVIVHGDRAIGVFALGIVIMGLGTGGFKSNIAPLIAEQYKDTKPYVRTNPDGSKVIVDPAVTSARVYLYFYFLINCGSLTGSIAMVYSEHYVGFWLSYLLPTIVFCLCPMILFAVKKHYILTPPTGSVMAKAAKLIRHAFKTSKYRDPDFWENAKPSRMAPENRPTWMTYDDAWVDEVRRGLIACKVFLWFPLYWLAYNQMTGNLVSQASTMNLGKVPNDIINNLNPLLIIICIPIMDYIVYPAIRKAGWNFTPIKKIAFGFFFASMAMVSATVTQAYIYKLSPCGSDINAQAADGRDCAAPFTVWIQVFPYTLIGLSEIFASITKLEYAYTKAPKNMRSTVSAIALFTSAISSALSQALVGLSEDPLLVWNYGSVAVVAAAGGIGFYLTFMKADRDEDKLNNLKVSEFNGRKNADEETVEGGLETVNEKLGGKAGL